MSFNPLTPGNTLWFQNQVWQIESVDAQRVVAASDLERPRPKRKRWARSLFDQLVARQAILLELDPLVRKPDDPFAAKALHMNDLSADQRQKTLRRLQAVKVVDDCGGSVDRALHRLRRDGGDVPARASLFAWYKRWLESGRDWRSQIADLPQRRRPRVYDGRLRILVEETVRAFYLTAERPSARKAARRIEAAIARQNGLLELEEAVGGVVPLPLPHPSASALCRHVQRHVKQMNPYVKAVRREGRSVANHRFRHAQAGVPVLHIGDRVEIDSTRIDLIVLDDGGDKVLGRLWLTSAIDCATRMVVGFVVSIDDPGADVAAECLYHMMSTKAQDRARFPFLPEELPRVKPVLLALDNGAAFVSERFATAAGDLDIAIDYLPPGMPWMKGMIERHFGTVNTLLFHNLPGTTKSNILALGDYDPANCAILTYSDALELVYNYMFVIYPNAPHESLGGRTPWEVWREKRAQQPPVEPPEDEVLGVVCLPSVNRRLSRKGVHFEGFRYVGAAVDAVLTNNLSESLDVKVYYQPNDLGMVYVRDPRTNRLFALPATDPRAEGLSQVQNHRLRAAVNAARARHSARALLEGEARETEIVQQARLRVQAAETVARGRKRRQQPAEPVSPPPPEPALPEVVTGITPSPVPTAEVVIRQRRREDEPSAADEASAAHEAPAEHETPPDGTAAAGEASAGGQTRGSEEGERT